MAFFRSRLHRHRPHSSGRLHPLAIVGICLGAAVLIALIVGNLLNLWLDDDTYKKLTDGETEPPSIEAPTPTRKVPLARIYPFTLGDPISSLTAGSTLPPPALSVSINTPTGELLYTSAVADYAGIDGIEKIPLTEEMAKLKTAVSYISGVFYPQAIKAETPDLIFAATASETALLHEFVTAGASEILLVGLSFEPNELAQTISYLKAVQNALENVYVGVAIPYSVASSSLGWQILPAILEAVDFMELDLQGAAPSLTEGLMLDANYYLVQYEMRLLINSKQTELIGIAEATLSDFQIVSAPPETPEEEVNSEAETG